MKKATTLEVAILVFLLSLCTALLLPYVSSAKLAGMPMPQQPGYSVPCPPYSSFLNPYRTNDSVTGMYKAYGCVTTRGDVILGGYPSVVVTKAATATLQQFSGYTINQEASAATAITYSLPATTILGDQQCIKNGYNGTAADTGVLTFKAATGIIIDYNGTPSASGGTFFSAGAAGDAACIVAIDPTHWEGYAQVGTWNVM